MMDWGLGLLSTCGFIPRGSQFHVSFHSFVNYSLRFAEHNCLMHF
jgi:hypothetical protein